MNNTLNVIKHTFQDNSKSIIDELSTRTQRVLFVKYYYTRYLFYFLIIQKYFTTIIQAITRYIKSKLSYLV